MQRVSATEFKAKCLQLLDQVSLTGERIQVTKHGRVVAEVVAPSKDGLKRSGPGSGKGLIKILGDIIEPVDLDWEAQH